MKELGLNVKTLEKQLHVSSPLGNGVRIDQICRDFELEISRIQLTVDLRVVDMSEFDVILGMDGSSLIVIVRGSPPIHQMVVALYFKGISMMLYPRLCTILDGTNSYKVGCQALPWRMWLDRSWVYLR